MRKDDWMREILFKAKTIKDDKWIEGYYICSNRKDEFEHRIQPLDAQCFAPPIKINTLCQYTGLTDNNGNKIWENDICRNIVDYHILKVTYWENDGCYMFEDQNENGNGYNLYEFEEVEVVGNVFDNPELLVATEN